MHLERTIGASAAQSWRVLGEDFVAIDAWASGMSSRALLEAEVPDGISVHGAAPVPGRVVTLQGKGEQIQVLVDFDPESRSFTFRAGNPPGVLAYAHNKHTVHDLGDGRSKVEIDVVIVPRGIGRLLKGKIQKKYTAYLEAYLDEAEAGIVGGSIADGGE